MSRRPPKTRRDLEYFERVIDDEIVVFVRDPIRHTYYRYNELQAAMLRQLDGTRPLGAIAADLSRQFDVEVPAAMAERFVVHARELMLLDVSSCDVPPPRAPAEVARALRRAGLRLDRLRDGCGARRSSSPEGMLLAEAIRHLDRGDLPKAVAALVDVQELNPGSRPAQTLLSLIQVAYLRASGSTTDYPTFVLFNPDRLLRFIDRLVGRLLFGWPGVCALACLVLLAIQATRQISFDSIHYGAFEIGAAIALFLLSQFLHELGHGLACHHYGGKVTEIGILMWFYIRPAPYCDTSGSYLIESRGHRMVVQLAGTLMTVAVVAVLSILLAVLHPGVTIYSSLAMVFVVETAVLFLNLIPFMKWDGYYALCDLLGMPNLRERAFRHARSWASAVVLGVTSNREVLTPRAQVLFLGFALCSLVFTVWWMYFIFVQTLGPLVDHLRWPGLVVAVAISAYVLRGNVLRPLGHLARLMVRQRRVIFTGKRLPVLVAAAGVLLSPCFIQSPARVDAEFVLVPRKRAYVRARHGGFVERIFVREGERVRRGQPVARLRDDDLSARIRIAEAELRLVDAELAKLTRGARGEELALAHRQLEVVRATGNAAAQAAARARKLAQQRLGPAAAADEAAGDAALSRALASAEGWRLASLERGSLPEEIAAAQARRASTMAQLDHLWAERGLLTLTSPIDGVVVTRHLEEARLELLEPGDAVAEIHDVEEFVAEIRLALSAPLGELAPGDRIALRAFGRPDVEVGSTLARVRQDGAAQGEPTADQRPVAITAPFATSWGRSGMQGRARLFGARHALAYSHVYLPVRRWFDVTLWSKL